MNKRWQPLIAVLLLVGLLTLVMRGVIRENILGPFLYLAWIGQLIFESIPQIALWTIFLLIAVVIALKSTFKMRLPRRRTTYPETGQAQRIGDWAKLLRSANEDIYYQWQLAQNLQKLTMETLAHDEHVALKEVRQRLTAGQLDISSEIQAYLQAGITSFGHFLEPKSRFRLRKKQSTPLDLDPEQVIQFLEEQIDHHPD